MRYIATTLILAVCLLTQLNSGAQNKTSFTQKKSTSAYFVKDWFLSTGNWHSDPQLYVCEFGSGRDTVVILHGGWGGDYSGMLTAVANLGSQFHFIFYDQRGSLRSPFPDSLISFDEHIQDVERLRAELRIEKLNIVGHSMGAVLASAYTAKYPQHIKRLVLLSPAALKLRLPNDEMALFESANNKFSEFLKRPAVENELKKHNLNRQSPPLSSREETMKFKILAFNRMFYDVSKCNEFPGGRALYKGNVYELTERTYPKEGWNYIQEFDKQLYPVTIIAGDHDFLDFGNVLASKWSKEVPRMKLKIVKNAGHMLWIDQPENFEKKLAATLSE